SHLFCANTPARQYRQSAHAPWQGTATRALFARMHPPALASQKDVPMSLLTHRFVAIALVISLSVAGLALVHLQSDDAEAALAQQQTPAAAVDVAEVRTRRISDWREYSG